LYLEKVLPIGAVQNHLKYIRCKKILTLVKMISMVNSMVIKMKNLTKIIPMNTKQLAKVMKALSHPNRLELYLEIAKKQETSYQAEHDECYVSDIMSCLNIGAPTISHHLKELANADLIVTERRGKFVVAKINEKTLQQVKQALSIKLE
jgi:ArsR family transcriptional regulator, arsenate/arsenite/antimonite-responsive transcriptional repressor